MAKAAKATKASDLSARKVLSRQLLGYFLPVHYRLGMDLEAVMCHGRVSRKQAAILWLIHARAIGDGWMRRREIEMLLGNWFEISNSNVSKLLRELAKPPLSLVDLVENPESGREKVVRLTKAGQVFLANMEASAVEFISAELSHVSIEEFQAGVDFAALAFGADLGETGRGDGTRAKTRR